MSTRTLPKSHDEYEALAVAWAIDALEPADEEIFEAHRHGCDDCALTVFATLEVAAELAYAVPDIEPPPLLRLRVLDAATPATETSRASQGIETGRASEEPVSGRASDGTETSRANDRPVRGPVNDGTETSRANDRPVRGPVNDETETGRANERPVSGRANDGTETGRANDGTGTGRAGDGTETGRGGRGAGRWPGGRRGVGCRSAAGRAAGDQDAG